MRTLSERRDKVDQAWKDYTTSPENKNLQAQFHKELQSLNRTLDDRRFMACQFAAQALTLFNGQELTCQEKAEEAWFVSDAMMLELDKRLQTADSRINNDQIQ